MIINRQTLLEAAPIKNMLPTKQVAFGVSYGCSEAGYDIRIKQEILFEPRRDGSIRGSVDGFVKGGRFLLASAIEEFEMPYNLTGIVHDKSTWARRGLSVFNTVVEPGWKGFLTLELVYHGHESLVIPAGSGIAQVIFHATANEARYEGKYQNQKNKPVEAIDSK